MTRDQSCKRIRTLVRGAILRSAALWVAASALGGTVRLCTQECLPGGPEAGALSNRGADGDAWRNGGTALPDLVIESFDVTSYDAETVTYTVVIGNDGTAPADLDGPTGVNWDNVSVQGFYSADTTFRNAGDVAGSSGVN